LPCPQICVRTRSLASGDDAQLLHQVEKVVAEPVLADEAARAASLTRNVPERHLLDRARAEGGRARSGGPGA
jgi:hypothetical protein